MPSAMETLLDKLDALIEERKLHGGDVRTPVCFTGLLDFAVVWHVDMPDPIFGISQFYEEEAGVTVNTLLEEPERIADLRLVHGHECGHYIAGHKGIFAVWTTEGKEAVLLNRGHGGWQEREADVAAAYLFVSRGAVKEMLEGESQETSYVARILEVPEYLVELRCKIRDRYGR